MSKNPKGRSLAKGLRLNSILAIAFILLNLLLIGIPSALVVAATVPLVRLLGLSTAQLNSQFLNVVLYMTIPWSLSFVISYWVAFGLCQSWSKLAKLLLYIGILYAWAVVLTFALTYYFTQ